MQPALGSACSQVSFNSMDVLVAFDLVLKSNSPPKNGGRNSQRERKEDGKPCVTSVTIILFEITFCQTSLSFKQIFL